MIQSPTSVQPFTKVKATPKQFQQGKAMTTTKNSPFDLARAKAGDPIYAGEREPAVFLMHAPDADPRQRVVVRIKDRIRLFSEQGKEAPTRGRPVILTMGPRIAYFNLYQDADNECIVHGQRFETLKEAEEDAATNPRKGFVATVPAEVPMTPAAAHAPTPAPTPTPAPATA
jgi:hypothetical protein